MKIENQAFGKVAAFAEKELCSYLSRMGCPALSFVLRVADLSVYGMAGVADSELDDQYLIRVDNEERLIAGNNPRALLLGVYRYLYLIGCRFLRPGRAFEIVPVKTNLADFYATEAHTASLRHRGVCIEGGESIDNIADFLDWLPKVGYNSFFFQFKNPHTFLRRWYELHLGGKWDEEASQRLTAYFDDLMDERGLLRHRMGHGWTADVIGAKNAVGWDREELELSEATQAILALVGGKRELYRGIPVNTNLCFSNPEALERFAHCVTDYLQKHPDTEYLHIWLADGANNSCECDLCNRLRPADHYITLLNFLGDRLSELGIKTRLCFLMYLDLLWPPIKNKLKDPDRFVLMFAPINRTFNRSYSDVVPSPSIPDFELNKSQTPKDIESNLALLNGWKKAVCCDSFVYDYHLGRAHHSEPSHLKMAKIICNDLRANRKIGLNGFVSCQELRIAFPNALANFVMGQASLNLGSAFEELAKDYYRSAYGASGEELLGVMEELSELFDCDYINRYFCPTPRLNGNLAKNMTLVEGVLDKIRDLSLNRKAVDYPIQSHMWDELKFFVDYTSVFARILLLRASDKTAEAKELFDSTFKPLLLSHEKRDQASLDVARDLGTIEYAID